MGPQALSGMVVAVFLRQFAEPVVCGGAYILDVDVAFVMQIDEALFKWGKGFLLIGRHL
jgi:hypothetical protein